MLDLTKLKKKKINPYNNMALFLKLKLNALQLLALDYLTENLLAITHFASSIVVDLLTPYKVHIRQVPIECSNSCLFYHRLTLWNESH